MSLQEAIDLGLNYVHTAIRTRSGEKSRTVLTTREVGVTRLIARGLTNRQIAEHLVLSVRTVETHVSRVLSKMGFDSRGQLTAWAHHEGLMTEPT